MYKQKSQTIVYELHFGQAHYHSRCGKGGSNHFRILFPRFVGSSKFDEPITLGLKMHYFNINHSLAHEKSRPHGRFLRIMGWVEPQNCLFFLTENQMRSYLNWNDCYLIFLFGLKTCQTGSHFGSINFSFTTNLF